MYQTFAHGSKTPNKDTSLNESKQSLVSEWLEKHENDFVESDIVYPCSPILGSSFTKRSPESPILKKCIKRPRRKYIQQNDSKQVEIPLQSDVDCSKIQQNSNILSTLGQSPQYEFQSREKSPDIFLSESPTTSKFQKSPILGGKILARKLERRKKNQILTTADSTLKTPSELNVSADTIPNKCNLSQIIEETFFEGGQIKEEDVKKEEEVLSQIIEDCEENSNPDLTLKNIKIEIEFSLSSSNDLSETKKDKIINNDTIFIEDVSESEKSESFIIEDPDTPAIENCAKEQIKIENVSSCKSLKDSQDTFFSKAESQQSQILPSSQRISEVSSTRINHPNSSEVHNIISNETASPKPILDTFSNILRSEKKKKKFKKGSFAAKIRKLVDTEKSFLRIWRHEKNQSTSQNVNSQFVELCIQNLYNAYSRQFAECFLMSDKYKLLNNLLKLETEISIESENTNVPSVTNKKLTLMFVPDFVGELKAKKGNTVRIYSPWEVIDQIKLTLSVMYFTVDTKANIEIPNEKFKENAIIKRIEIFDCPCITEGKIVENCNIKFTNKKPNVMKEIFSSS